MNDERQQLAPEVWQKFFAHIPEGDDLTLIILKGHLLVEEELRKLIEDIFKHPEHLKGGRFTFFQTYKLVKAFHFEEDKNWLWDSIERLNIIRNKYAHNLEPEEIENQIEFLTYLVCSKIRTNETALTGKLRHSLAMIFYMLYDLRCRSNGNT